VWGCGVCVRACGKMQWFLMLQHVAPLGPS